MTPDQVAEFAGIARAQGWRLDRLISDLLVASRAQRCGLTVNPEVTPVSRVLGTAVQSVSGPRLIG